MMKPTPHSNVRGVHISVSACSDCSYQNPHKVQQLYADFFITVTGFQLHADYFPTHAATAPPACE